MKTCKFIFYIDKSPIYLVHEKLFCPRSGYAAIVPAVRLHLDVVAGYEPLPPVQLRAVPVHVVLLVQHLQDLVLAEAQLVVGRRIEVMLGNSLHYCSNFSVVVVDVSLGWELSVQKHTRGDQKKTKMSEHCHSVNVQLFRGSGGVCSFCPLHFGHFRLNPFIDHSSDGSYKAAKCFLKKQNIEKFINNR